MTECPVHGAISPIGPNGLCVMCEGARLGRNKPRTTKDGKPFVWQYDRLQRTTREDVSDIWRNVERLERRGGAG